jgi:hypothetical protein
LCNYGVVERKGWRCGRADHKGIKKGMRVLVLEGGRVNKKEDSIINDAGV